jgi:hypothetical protein
MSVSAGQDKEERSENFLARYSRVVIFAVP